MLIQTDPITRADVEPDILRDRTVDGSGDVAVPLPYPPRSAHHWPTVVADNVIIRGDWRIGMRLTNGWNADLERLWICGALMPAPFLQPRMDIALDLGTSMDVHVSRPRIVHAGTGISLADPYKAENFSQGFHLSGGWFQHCLTDIYLKGLGAGGHRTPVARILFAHLAHLKIGLHIEGYRSVTITGVNFYGEPYFNPTLALYLKNCSSVTISDCDFWRNANDVNGHAIVLDGCHGVGIKNCFAEQTLAAHLVAMNCTELEVDCPRFLSSRVWIV
jgi:hypothetical protein